MNWGIFTWFILAAISFGVHIAKHGETWTKEYNWVTDLISSLLAFLLIFWVAGWTLA